MPDIKEYLRALQLHLTAAAAFAGVTIESTRNRIHSPVVKHNLHYCLSNQACISTTVQPALKGGLY